MIRKKILALIFGIPLISCSILDNNYGFMRASVKFPERAFNIKVIPDNTSVILVKVVGEGLNEPILFELDRNNTSKLLKNVPEGNKDVNASAFDEEGNVIAKGQNSVNVIAQQLNTVEVELKLNDKIKPTPSLEPVNCKIELEEKDFPLSENLSKAIEQSGCKIVKKPTPNPSPSFSPTTEPTTPSSNTSDNFSSGSSSSSSNNVTSAINIVDGQQKDSPDIILDNP
ncbi:MAG: hypothetical protein KatS3mg068_1246 [Candidatus Sericytochromatia bacterium]|nr:MAG: hypothetical protein KatS3mg068_1246 [Candidatus Sericytochromatia bacterium]